MKSILFNTEMVNAIQEKRKTVTRQLVKKELSITGQYTESIEGYEDGTLIKSRMMTENFIQTYAPYKTGDILYVRETWAKIPGASSKGGFAYKYKASEEGRYWNRVQGFKWKPSIHMPKDAARIFLLVTGIRLERLHDIDDTGIEKEGIKTQNPDARQAFSALWDSTVNSNETGAYGWDANPWVWVIEFEKTEKEKITTLQ